MGLGGVAVGFSIALIADVLLFSLAGNVRPCSALPRLAAGLIVAGCAGVVVAGFRLGRDSRPGEGLLPTSAGLFLTAAGIAGLLVTAPLTVLVFAAPLCRS
jgi:hypothetical protein